MGDGRPAIPTRNLYLYLKEANYGPVTLVQIRELFRQNEITRATPLWYEGLENWIAVGDIPEFDRRTFFAPPPIPTETKGAQLWVSIRGEVTSLSLSEIKKRIDVHEVRRTDYAFDDDKNEWLRTDQHPHVRRFYTAPPAPKTEPVKAATKEEKDASDLGFVARHKAMLIAASVVVVLGGFLIGGYLYWISLPKYALVQIASSIVSKDKKKFHKYVNLEKVTENIVDDFVEKGMKELKLQNAGSTQKLGEAFSEGLVEMMKPQIQKFVSVAVAKYFEGGTETSAPPMPGMEKIFSRIGSSEMPLQFTGISSQKSSEGITYLSLGFRHKQFGKDLSLTVKLERSDGVWQVIHLTNLLQTVEELNSWDEAYVAQVNAPIIKEMNSALVLAQVLKKNNESPRTSILEMHIRNASSETIEEFKGSVQILGDDNTILYSIVISDSQPLLPGRTFSGIATKDINKFVSADLELYKKEAHALKTNLRIDYIKFSNGKELKLQSDAQLAVNQ